MGMRVLGFLGFVAVAFPAADLAFALLCWGCSVSSPAEGGSSGFGRSVQAFPL